MFTKTFVNSSATPNAPSHPMPRDAPAKRKPTDAELAILGVLWDRGHATVREVHGVLEPDQGVGYTTVLKLMQIMIDKGLLKRDTSVRPQVYRPAKPKKQMQGFLLRDLWDRAFAGSPGNLVLQALSTRKPSADELAEIRVVLDKLEAEGK